MSPRRMPMAIGVLVLSPCVSAVTCMNAQNTSLPVSTPTASFDVRPDGTVTARGRGLMWMRCLLGQSLVNNLCTGEPSLFSRNQALVAAAAQDFAGHDDWRLPNVKEILSIIEDRCARPGLNADLFPISTAFAVWSSTQGSWLVHSNGWLRFDLPQPSPVLLVRDVPN